MPTAAPGLALIDTNIISKTLRGRDGARARLVAIPRERLRMSAMVLAELEYAALRADDPPRHRAKWLALIDGIPVLPFDGQAVAIHAQVRLALRHQPIGERDLIIAATALAHNCTLITNNLREFARVPGLRVEDWSGA